MADYIKCEPIGGESLRHQKLLLTCLLMLYNLDYFTKLVNQQCKKIC